MVGNTLQVQSGEAGCHGSAYDAKRSRGAGPSNFGLMIINPALSVSVVVVCPVTPRPSSW